MMSLYKRHISFIFFFSVVFGLFSALPLFGQYFGRNKVLYDDFHFKVMHTENFDVYFYPRAAVAVEDAARMVERWNTRLSRVLNHKLSKRQPLILYANHADFQQTNVISGLIGQGTGGVTEGLQNRIVIPLTGVYQQNDHVLGHELVHGYQYDMVRTRGMGFRALGQLPLWMIEGMAEYLSAGRDDPHTAMWLRDALLNDDLPTVSQLNSGRYFPYRYGQALWAYIAGRWGDAIIDTLFSAALHESSLDSAFIKTIGMNGDSLSADWHNTLRGTLSGPISERDKPAQTGTVLLSRETGSGEMNLAPAISPDGRYVAFLSEKDLFTIDLFIADAQTGKVLDKLASSASDAHFEALRFMNSAGAWSPDSRQFAFVVFAKGDNHIVISDVETRNIQQKIRVNEAGEIFHLAWSPDGETLVFSGSEGGISDLYAYNFKNKTTEKLTDDRYANIQPAWSPDGQKIAFVTDRGPATDLQKLQAGPMNIALMDFSSGEVEVLDIFSRSKHINPVFAPDGQSLFFVADPDGFSNIYRLSLSDRNIYRVTNVATGVSGITADSPCLTVAQQSGRMLFSVFDNTYYKIFAKDSPETRGVAVPARLEMLTFNNILPPQSATGYSFVSDYLDGYRSGFPQKEKFAISDYKPSLRLSHIGQPSVGVGVDQFGSYVGGGVSLYFSDILNTHTLGVGAQVSGTLKDFGGQVLYINRSNRLNWGAAVSRIPYRVEQAFTSVDTVTVNGTDILARSINFQRFRIFDNRAMLLGEYPLSTNRRIEASAGYNRTGYDLEVEEITSTFSGQVIDRETRDLPAPDALNLFKTSIAYVGDYSFFGFTSPVKGRRFRLEAEPTFGTLQFLSVLADYRQYLFLKPFTFAMRALHFGRYGTDAESRQLNQLFLGYGTFVRGYSGFTAEECSRSSDPNGCPEYDRLFGTRLAIVNAEFRLPLFGTERFGLINFPYLPTELSAFFDGGLAWQSGDDVSLEFNTDTAKHVPVFSSGLAARFNLLGSLIGQVYYAIPFQRPQKDGKFGFVFSAGW